MIYMSEWRKYVPRSARYGLAIGAIAIPFGVACASQEGKPPIQETRSAVSWPSRTHERSSNYPPSDSISLAQAKEAPLSARQKAEVDDLALAHMQRADHLAKIAIQPSIREKYGIQLYPTHSEYIEDYVAAGKKSPYSIDSRVDIGTGQRVSGHAFTSFSPGGTVETNYFSLQFFPPQQSKPGLIPIFDRIQPTEHIPEMEELMSLVPKQYSHALVERLGFPVERLPDVANRLLILPSNFQWEAANVVPHAGFDYSQSGEGIADSGEKIRVHVSSNGLLVSLQ